jgi:hypothetical protein
MKGRDSEGRQVASVDPVPETSASLMRILLVEDDV